MSKTLIMIPVYNAESFISRSIKSALKQTLKSQIWIVDNNSTDRTNEIVANYERRYPQIRLFSNKHNIGRVGNWNKCLNLFEKSKYQYLKWLFSGDELFPDCIAKVEQAFQLDNEIAAVAFPYEFKDLDGNTSIVKDYQGNHLFDKKTMKLINIESGGFLSTIVCNTYNKKFINGYKFLEEFITKNDFDFKIFSDGKGYYLDRVLARFNLDSRGTYHKALDYITETEFAFNRAFWLEKMKNSFTQEEYQRIREKIYVEFATRNIDYYPPSTIVKMILSVVKRLPNRLLLKTAEFKNNLIHHA